MRYLVHPESASAFRVLDDDYADHLLAQEPLLEDVSEEEFLKACSAFGDDPDDPPVDSPNRAA